jgi:hypothetical protein
MEGFQDAVADCGLLDLGFSGLSYTWDNRQGGNRNVKARLDRAFGDHRFLEAMGDTTVKVLPTVFSDHSGLLIEVKEPAKHVNTWPRGRRPFRYEDMWQRHPDYVDFVNQTWDPSGCDGLSSMATSLERLQVELSAWDRDVFGSVRKKLRHLRKELESERSHTLYRGPTDRERFLMKELAEVLGREEEMERQRSRVEWLKSGDRNTGFFQARRKLGLARTAFGRLKELMERRRRRRRELS